MRTRINRLAFLAALALLPRRAKAQSTVSPALRTARDVFKTAQASYTLTRAPFAGGIIQVYLNGLLMLEGVDYTYTAPTITFSNSQPVGPGAILQVLYSIAE